MVEMQAYDVAVVGLGAMGSAALYAAARRGLRVIGFDRLEPGHNRSSSFGESRVIRLAYFEHPSYVPLLRGAYRAWRDFEVATGESVLTITGILEAGHPGAALVEGSVRSAREHDLPHELLSPRQVNDRFPAFLESDGGRARSPSVAQRPTGGRGTALETAPVVLPGGRQHARHVEPLSRL
jgi:sarcosine oxidase